MRIWQNQISKPVWLVYAALVFTIPFLVHYQYLLNAFYHFGAPINDAGIFAQLVWRGDLRLTPPLVFTNYSFYGVHCAPILSVLTLLSYISPTNMAEYYSIFLSTIYAAIGLVLFCALTKLAEDIKHWQILIIAVISGLFAFNNSIMHGIWIGHFEYAIPLGIFLFLIFFAQNKKLPTLLAFIFTLSIREDAGFHLTAALGLLMLVRLWERRSIRAIKLELKFIAAAALYSVFAIWITMYARDYYSSTFQTIYSGEPFYAHLNWDLLMDRLGIITFQHPQLVIGLVVSMALTIWLRNIYMIIGFAAYLPWFLLNWTAYNENTAQFYAYYSFPFILSLMWPVIGAVCSYGYPIPQDKFKPIIIAQVIMVLSSVVMLNDSDKSLEFGPSYGARWGSYEIQKGTKNRDKVLQFFDGVISGKGNLGVVMADQSSITMIRGGQYQGRDLLRVEADKPADTIIAMLPDKNNIPLEITKQIHQNQLPYKYCMKETSICIFTNRKAQELGE